MRQFVQLLTNSDMGLSTDLWVPATDKLKPQESWQAALGLSRSMGSFEVSLACYYKEMDNLIEYQSGASYTNANENWEEKVVLGEGNSYGLEFLVQREAGRLSGWMGYTCSYTNRKFDELNYGRRFPYKYDRRHDISLVTVYEVNDRTKLTGTWVYASGNVVSIPDSKFKPFNELIFKNYNYILNNHPSRNNFRMRPHHRLDLGISMSKKKRRGLRTWSFGAYNAYYRRNPFYIDIDNDGHGQKLLQLSIFPIIPYVNYSFEF